MSDPAELDAKLMMWFGILFNAIFGLIIVLMSWSLGVVNNPIIVYAGVVIFGSLVHYIDWLSARH